MRGFGGRSGSGGPLIRPVGRAVRATGVGGGVSASANANANANTSANANANADGGAARAAHKKPSAATVRSISTSSSNPYPISPISTAPGWSSLAFVNRDEWDWVTVDASSLDDEISCGCFEDCVFGSVPSSDEAQAALHALQQALDPSSSELTKDKYFTDSDKDKANQLSVPTRSMCWVGSDSDWNEPSPLLMLQGLGGVYDAFHLLQTEPSVQRMVISLSSDEAVWDAVMKNQMVQQLKESFYAAEKKEQISDETSSSVPNPAVSILKWIFSSTKAKFAEIIQKVTEIVNQLAQSAADEEMSKGASELNPFEKRMRSSLMISIMILFIVVLTRANRA